MSAPEVTVIEDIRPLIALVAPLIGLIGIVWAGEKRRNLRETFTFLAAIVQASAVLSMVPLLLGGGIIEFHIWQIFTNVPLLLRVDGFGLLLPVLLRFFGLPLRFMPLGICVDCMNMHRRDSIHSSQFHYRLQWGSHSRLTYSPFISFTKCSRSRLSPLLLTCRIRRLEPVAGLILGIYFLPLFACSFPP